MHNVTFLLYIMVWR